MLALSVDQQRVALHVKIQIFAHPYKMVNSLIFDLRDTSAFAASYLHMYLFAGDHFVLRSAFSPLPVNGVNDLRFDESL